MLARETYEIAAVIERGQGFRVPPFFFRQSLTVQTTHLGDTSLVEPRKALATVVAETSREPMALVADG